MPSFNWDPPKMSPVTRPTVHRDNPHQHTMSASQIPSFMNRNIPSYYVTGEYSPQSNNSSASPSAPRYSPQPWKRQHSHGSLSFMSSPRPEQSDYTTSQQPPRRPADRAPVCLSPFRSVRRMKQPFQLMLPSSPSCENIPFAKEQRASRQRSGNQELRTWCFDQNLNASLETFGLLPSPPLSDSHTSHPSFSSAYFSPNPDPEHEKGPGITKACGCAPGGKLCDSCDVPKSRTQDEEQKRPDGITNVHMAHSTLIKQCEDNDRESSPQPAETEHAAPSPTLGTAEEEDASDSPANAQRTRAGTATSGVSWVPDNFSYCQNWLQGVETMDVKDQKSKEVNRRKFQIVQVGDKIGSSPSPANHDVKDVKLAVASKTKPKLVDISSHQSSPSMSCSPPNQHHMVPTTPDHGQQEVSAFSPDTPLEMSDSGYTTQQSCFSPGDSQEDKDDDGYTDASSMTSESVSSTIVCDKPVLNPEKPVSPLKTDLPSKIRLAPKPEASPGSSSNMSEKEQLEKWWDHEWTIDQLEHSVKDFPHQKLKLTSPVIMFLRKNDEKSLIHPFRKIFPEAAESSLDTLCAALIARNYIVELSSNNRRHSGFSHKHTLSRLDNASEKVGSNLGIHFAQASPSQIKHRVLGSRSSELRKELDQIVDSLLISVCGRPDETLKSAVLVLAQVLEAKT